MCLHSSVHAGTFGFAHFKSTFVVMRRIDEVVIRKGKQFGMDVLVERLAITFLEVRPTTTADQERVTSEDLNKESPTHTFGIQFS